MLVTLDPSSVEFVKIVCAMVGALPPTWTEENGTYRVLFTLDRSGSEYADVAASFVGETSGAGLTIVGVSAAK